MSTSLVDSGLNVMSFHHAPPGKGSSSSDVEPLCNSSQQADSRSEHPLSPDMSNQERLELLESYGEEARFELLSAYVDDEVTPQERKLVAQWLMDDPSTLKMYRRLLMLRQAIRTAPIHTPPSSSPPLQVPSPPQLPWHGTPSSLFRRTLSFAVAIALLSGLLYLNTADGRQQLKEAWYLLKSLPQSTLPAPESHGVTALRPMRADGPKLVKQS